MVSLETPICDFGWKAPDFNLPATDGKSYSKNDIMGENGLLIAFICNHCPYVKAIHERFVRDLTEIQELGIGVAAIMSNDPTDYPTDAPENLLRRWQEKEYRFPYLVDDTQEVARAFGAVCTPDIFVYDENRRLAYHGQLDDNWKEPHNVKRQDLKIAVEALLGGKKPPSDQKSSMGCSIKWKKE